MSLQARAPLAVDFPRQWAREHAMDHRNLLLVGGADERWALADAVLEGALRASTRAIVAVAEASEVDARRETLEALGIGEVLAATGDGLDPRALSRGPFDALVITVERLGELLARAPRLCESVGLVVVDGVDRLADGAESPLWDRALTLLRVAALPPRIVALAAPTKAQGFLARWLDAQVQRDPQQLDLEAAPAVDAELALESVIVPLAVAGLLRPGELRRLALASFAGMVTYRRLAAAGDPKIGFSLALDAAVDRCVAAGALTIQGDFTITATEAGRLAVALGLGVDTLAELGAWVRSWGTEAPTCVETSLVVARTAACAGLPAPSGGSIHYRAAALASARALGIAGRPVLRWLADEVGDEPDAEVTAILRRAAIVDGLLSDQRRGDLFTFHQATPAIQRRLAAAFARPIMAAAALARQLGRPALDVDAVVAAARRLDPTVRAPILRAPAASVPVSAPRTATAPAMTATTATTTTRTGRSTQGATPRAQGSRRRRGAPTQGLLFDR
ncbi:MAG: hypothetical protein R3B09_16745 [Nannocystaceae bacterium]